MHRTLVYIHGKGGRAEESAHYRELFPGWNVCGMEYRAQTPWDALAEFPAAFEALTAGSDAVTLVANSIGAYFAMSAMLDARIDRAYFISPIVDMEKLICDMMRWANVTEAELCRRGEIETAFGETLSWEYLEYARSHPVRWNVPTEILYGGLDSLTARETIAAFAAQHRARLTVMEQGEHWFHTPKQMAFLDAWILEGEA